MSDSCAANKTLPGEMCSALSSRQITLRPQVSSFVPKCLTAGEMVLASVCRKLHVEGNACKGTSRLL